MISGIILGKSIQIGLLRAWITCSYGRCRALPWLVKGEWMWRPELLSRISSPSALRNDASYKVSMLDTSLTFCDLFMSRFSSMNLLNYMALCSRHATLMTYIVKCWLITTRDSISFLSWETEPESNTIEIIVFVIPFTIYFLQLMFHLFLKMVRDAQPLRCINQVSLL